MGDGTLLRGENGKGKLEERIDGGRSVPIISLGCSPANLLEMRGGEEHVGDYQKFFLVSKIFYTPIL
jgi:hypothetical protein